MKKKIKASSCEIVCNNPEAVKAVVVAVNTGKSSDVVIDGNGGDVLNAMFGLMNAVMQTMLESGESDKAIMDSFAAMCASAFKGAVERHENKGGF